MEFSIMEFFVGVGKWEKTRKSNPLIHAFPIVLSTRVPDSDSTKGTAEPKTQTKNRTHGQFSEIKFDAEV